MKISTEQLDFPLCIKNKILKIKDITKLHLEFISGKYIRFNKTNLALQEPHKIVISNDEEYVMLLAYENDSTLYSADLSITISSTVDKTLLAEGFAIEVKAHLEVYGSGHPEFESYLSTAKDELKYTSKESKEILEMARKILKEKYNIKVLSDKPFSCIKI